MEMLKFLLLAFLEHEPRHPKLYFLLANVVLAVVGSVHCKALLLVDHL